MALRLPKLSGMEPFNWFSARSKICKELKFETTKGSSPENLFDLRLSILRRGKASPNQPGKFPVNMLFPKSKVSNFDKF
uniref:Uncharacterized protein n=1 Tax=Manihot esculenta TaxID=3983 RepID=A0A2C9V5V0_MANES